MARPGLFAALFSDAALTRNGVLWGSGGLTLATVLAGLHTRQCLWGLVLLLPVLAVCLYDLTQREHALRRNFPGSARMRWFFEWLRPYLHAYIVEGELDGRPFNHDERALIYARAHGTVDAHPFGTDLDVYSGEYEWLAHSMQPNPDAPKDMRVKVGSDQCARPYMASRLNISAMSFGALGANAIAALNLGAKTAGCYHDTGEGAMSPYHLAHGGDVVWQIASGYFGCRDAQGRFDPAMFADHAAADSVRMIEIKLSQGAKPGHGGMLPAAKITPEIAATRGIAMGQDCISPPGHSAFRTPRELVEFAARLRELSGGKPVGLKLCVGLPHELFAIAKAMVETGITLDFIVIDGAEGGTGAAPKELSDRMGMPLREGLILARNALVGAGLKGQVRLAASGKVTSGASIAINAALGADWCNAARAFMFSLGCIQSRQCHTGHCPTGIATQSPARQRALVVEEKAERVARFHRATVHALHEIVVAAGLDSPSDFRPSHLRQRINVAEMRQMDEIYPFVQAGELLNGTGHEQLRRWWEAADPDSFRRRDGDRLAPVR
ncbi:FMN-binding glutamate synthase family protein [Novosphingobium sp. FSY-8]|uniref:FMN-binding glutamate synthase family protein n=1 Tax=Novosphingobium ovatum TaxID=1908523 RepID=A0ABW9XG76_9SPHN|nr:FMN-binding glutamate synthase family protein [Novosphingobium ovatum]NBC37539.1 FMN-binding glutamate synthase family protein [Novosphingobium ovatum]